MRRLYLTIKNPFGHRIFSDFIENIDSVESHTVIYRKDKYLAANIIRMPFNISSISLLKGIVIMRYDNGLCIEIIRK
jgi:hypothetical protein